MSATTDSAALTKLTRTTSCAAAVEEVAEVQVEVQVAVPLMVAVVTEELAVRQGYGAPAACVTAFGSATCAVKPAQFGRASHHARAPRRSKRPVCSDFLLPPKRPRCSSYAPSPSSSSDVTGPALFSSCFCPAPLLSPLPPLPLCLLLAPAPAPAPPEDLLVGQTPQLFLHETCM